MPNLTPEQEARENIDRMLEAAGWVIQDVDKANISAAQGVAIREFPLKTGHGFADYLLYVDGKAAGVIEAKPAGTTLTGVEIQSEKYRTGLPDELPAWDRPLPFCYESTGAETQFTNIYDPDHRSRRVFSFHKPETHAGWLSGDIYIASAAGADAQHVCTTEATGAATEAQQADIAADSGVTYGHPSTLRSRLRDLPTRQPLITGDLWPAQITAITNLEQSMAANRSRAVIQMATGSGKTFTAINFIYRLIKFGGARRVLFLVDRGNLGKQTHKEFQQYVSPYNNFKFTEEYIVQRLSSNTLDTTARVCISTIQRLYSMLKGTELEEGDDEQSAEGLDRVFAEIPPIEYNPAIPIETFDVIITDECHRSIYGLWRQVLEYFDAFIIGLTATPNKQTFGFFNQNLVMEYGHEEAVADNVNVNYDVYRIKTQVTAAGGKVDAGYYVDKRDRDTREVRWEQLDDDFEYDPNQLDRNVVAVDQIRTIIRTYRDKLFTEIFPGRTEVPKTLIYAKDDSHAEDIVKIVREVFDKGNEFAQKITYRTTGRKPEELIAEFRNSYFPRIAVTVDMIATGTDIKPLEVVLFMRSVKSRSYFEQMKGRGVRIINDNDLQAVTPDAGIKDRFIIVDAVGVCEEDKTDSRPLDKKKSVPFDKLLQAISLGNTDPDVISSVAVRIARMQPRLSDEDREAIEAKLEGKTIKELTGGMVAAINPDNHTEQARQDHPYAGEPDEAMIDAAATKLIQGAVAPLHDPELRALLFEIKRKNEQTIDHVSQDEVIEAGFSADALDKAKGLVASFRQFIEDNKDEITALQIIYSKPYQARLQFNDVKELADTIERPPYLWNESQLWQAYAALDEKKVRGAGGRRILTDLVSLVRYAIDQDNELVPFPERVEVNFNAWLAQQENEGKEFKDEQLQWLDMIKDHIAANLKIETEDFDFAPFNQEGGLGKVHELFGDGLEEVLDELNGVLAR